MTELQMSMMEAGSEPPAPPPADPPPPPPPPPSDRASGGRRSLAFLGFVVLAFGCAVMAVAAADIGTTPTCADVQSGKAAVPSDNQCFDGGSTKKAVTVGMMWPGAVLAGIAALLALVFTVTGRNGRRVMLVTAAAIVVSGLGILIGSI